MVGSIVFSVSVLFHLISTLLRRICDVLFFEFSSGYFGYGINGGFVGTNGAVQRFTNIMENCILRSENTFLRKLSKG